MRNPLLDKNFLLNLDKYRNRVIYSRITNLTNSLYGVERIEGVVSGGSVTIDGSSVVRRICSLTLTTKKVNTNFVYWSLTSRIKIEIGIERKFDFDVDNPQFTYDDYPDIIWFPLGVYILTDFNTQQQVNNYIITLTGKDKMCLLNGDVGGVFTAETDCGKIDYQREDGKWVREDLPIKTSILNLVHHYAGDKFEDILIKDLDKLAVRDIRNNTRYRAYLIRELNSAGYENFVECLFYNPQVKKKATSDSQEILFGYIPEKTYYYKANGKWSVDFNNTPSGFKFITKKDISEDDVGLVSQTDWQKATIIYYVTYDELSKENDRYSPSNNYYYYDSELADYIQINLDYSHSIDIDADFEALFDEYPQVYVEVQHNCVVMAIDPKETIGYKVQEMIYPSDLIATAGSTVTSILDKILEEFPTFEYFYNLNGQFVFQQKKQYTKTSFNNLVMNENNEYYVDPSEVQDYVQYIFDDNKLAVAHQNTPKLSDIKNDFTVWGKRKSSSGNEIPIHARYAIDKKPFFYKSFDGTVFSSDVEYATTYANSVMDIVMNKKPHGVPEFLEDKINWWHIQDWENYYIEVTGKQPTLSMSNYMAEDNGGFTQDLYFPNRKNPQLIVRFGEDAPKNPEDRQEYVYYLGKHYIGFIFDVEKEGEWAGYPVQWRGWADEAHTVPVTEQSIRIAFQHNYKGCGHKYTWFLDKAERYGYDSYIYKPVIPADLIVNPEAYIDMSLVIQCDWRELIFQMAKDYYQYGQTDTYGIYLHKNNFYPNYGIDLYEGGHTGYEQYYTDLEAFWRQLYCPVEFLESDNFIINSMELDKKDFFLSGTFKGWKKDVIEDPASLIFWFDFFDADGFGLNQYAVPAIGSRPAVENNDQISNIINTDTPDLIFISKEDYDMYEEAGRLADIGAYQYMIYSAKESSIDGVYPTDQKYGYDFSDVATKNDKFAEGIHNIYVDADGALLERYTPINSPDCVSLASTYYSAQEFISNMLYEYAYAHETITITGVPIYYLEPNMIISAKDELHIVNGYYILNKIVLPLQAKGTMQITAIRVPERVY